jgi:hypothetical protein
MSIDFWGLQLEAGSVATAFQTATGTIQGELDAAQRYYYRISSSDAGQATNYLGFANGYAPLTTAGKFAFYPSSKMRTGPTSVDYANLLITDGSGATFSPSSITVDTSSTNVVNLTFTTTGLTQFRPYSLFVNGSTSAYIGLSAEL